MHQSLLKVEIMSLSEYQRDNLRFLLDENVKKELLQFLDSKNYDTKIAPKGLKNGKLSDISKIENRILITNDRHFANPNIFPKEKIFSVILLQIKQNESDILLDMFSKLLKEKNSPEDFEGSLIILNEENFEITLIPESKAS